MAVIPGTSGPNNLTGTAGADTITGLAGNDTLTGLGGNDSIDGGADNDTIDGGSGDDTLIGGTGVDSILGGDGHDLIDAGVENDTVDGGANADTINAGDGNNTVMGSGGHDTITAGSGNDTISGGSNNDVINAGGGTNTVYGGSGHDTITSGDQADVIYGDKAPTDTVPGGSFDYQAFLYGTNFTDPSPVVQHYGPINITGAPITITFKDDDAFLRTDGLGANNDVYNEPNQIVVINGVEYPVLLEQIVTYQDQNGNTYRFLQCDYDFNHNGFADQGNLQEQGGLVVFLPSNAPASATPPPSGARLTVVSDSIDTTSDHEYDAYYNDSIVSGAGADLIYGQQGNDTILSGADNDTVDGGIGDDVITGGDGQDSLLGGLGNDTISGGLQADFVDGGDGNDSIMGDGGADNLIGGLGNDTIDGGTENDLINGNDGNDSLLGGDGADSIFGGTGDDIIDGGANNDSIEGNDGADRVSGGEGDDNVLGGAGNDTLLGDGGADFLSGGAGDDSLNGGLGVDTLDGGTGSDQFAVGFGDRATGGDDRDTFTLTANGAALGGFNVDGGTGSGTTADYDRIVLADGMTRVLGTMTRTLDADGDSYSGSFQVRDANGDLHTVTFTEIEEIPVCFVRGSLIETIDGPRPIETLRAGDMIRTRDNGYKAISWIGSRAFRNDRSETMTRLSPIRIRSGALGKGVPSRDLYLSPQHRVLVRSKIAERMFGGPEVLVAVKHLLALPGIEQVTDFGEVEYFHILFDQHEIVYADGLEAESLYTGPEALKALDPEARREILTIFPELAQMTPDIAAPPARFIPRGRMARQLAARHHKNSVPLQ